MLSVKHQIATNGRHGNYLEFAHHAPNLLALVANDNYAITGGGELAVVSVEYGNAGLQFSGRASVFPFEDALCSLCWCHSNPHNILTGCRNGDILLWNISNPMDRAILKVFKGPKKEVSSIACSPIADNFVTASWDGSLLFFDVNRLAPVSVVDSLPTLLYDVRWSPHSVDTFITSSGDGCVRVYERNMRGLTIPCHPTTDVLSVDWSPTQPGVIAAASTDGTVSVWDLRTPQHPLMLLQGHRKAVNRVRFSPHVASMLATSSYDFTTRVWQGDGSVLTSACHSEFSVGVSWSKIMGGVLADCSWDATIALYIL